MRLEFRDDMTDHCDHCRFAAGGVWWRVFALLGPNLVLFDPVIGTRMVVYLDRLDLDAYCATASEWLKVRG